MNIIFVEGIETCPCDLGKEMEASLISAAIVESIVSASVSIAEKRNVAPPLQQEITCVETQEQQKHEERVNKMDDQDDQGI